MGHARPRHATTRVTAQTAARISAPQQRQLLDPGTMEREEPRDHLRSHLSRNTLPRTAALRGNEFWENYVSLQCAATAAPYDDDS